MAAKNRTAAFARGQKKFLPHYQQKKYNLTFKMAGFKDADIRKKKEINRRKRYYY